MGTQCTLARALFHQRIEPFRELSKQVALPFHVTLFRVRWMATHQAVTNLVSAWPARDLVVGRTLNRMP
jgi:hypothetical protein